MTAFEVIERAAAADLVDEDGERVVWKALPGLTANDISALEGDLGFRVPDELRDLLARCGGVDGALESIDFTGRLFGGFGMDEIFPKSIPIAHDGFGNYWVLDAVQADAARTPVFFACQVWRKNPGTLTIAEAAIRDGELRAFAATLDERFTVVDLRGVPPGMGFSWGRYGPRTEIRRHGTAPVFAYAAPPKRSLWSRLWGR